MFNATNREKSFMSLKVFGLTIVSILVLAIAGMSQDLPPTNAQMQTIPSGSYVIAMDNTKQNIGANFNLKAYGLVNHLLQNGIPVLWAIKSGKTKDTNDFTVNAKRIKPTAISTASLGFAGGPFIVRQENAAAALPLITAFGNNVAVYETTASASIDIRYTLTHKPLIAVGLANGSNSDIHKRVFNDAGIPDYIDYDDSTVNATSCVTLIAQPHVDAANGDPHVANYRQFSLSGGNVFYQCKAIETYENDLVNGLFQTTAGWTLANSSSTNLNYPNPDMPLSQFIGGIDGDQSGYETDFVLGGGSSLQNGTFASAQNRFGAQAYIATTSKVFYGGPGGMIFELGGHDYRGSGTASTNIEDLNAQRMLLNAVFVPPTRPFGCGLDTPTIYGYKSAQMTTDVDSDGAINPGDTITWTINYVNVGAVTVNSFQINDTLPAGMTYVGPLTVTFGGGATASANVGYAGTGGLLAAGAVLPPNGRITVQVKATISLSYIPPGTLNNQTGATGTELSSTVINSDNIDATTIGTQGTFPPPPAGSVPQTQNSSIDPTSVPVVAVPTAANASYSGRIVTVGGAGIRGAVVTLYNTSTMQTHSATSNTFGDFTIQDLPIGDFYILSITHRRYWFPISNTGFVVTDDVVGDKIIGMN